MKPAPFDYFSPATVDEALALLVAHGGDAKPLAGGQSLIPAMNFRLARPAVLVDLNRISELAYVRAESGGIAVGAMTRQRAVERSDVVARAAPLLAEAMPSIAHPQIRNRGTVGGSIAHADPSAELPAVMLALDARFRAKSASGERSIPAGEFFKGMLETALEPGELLVEIALSPLPARSGTAFLELARRHGDYALVGVAATVTLDPRGRCKAARLSLLSVGDGPVLATEAGKVLAGQTPSEELLRAAGDAAARRDVDPPSDIHASAAYRRQLVAVLTRRALGRAFERAGKNFIAEAR
jgi:carbon-monoxide dehydrogenase medium subunit